MGKAIYIIYTVLLMVLTAGCQQESAIEWHISKEAAVEYGLKQEQAEPGSVISIEAFEGETIVFYEYRGGLGIAHIAESERGYGWKRSQPYYDFETTGKLDFSTSAFDIEMESGPPFSVLIGKAFDPSIQQMKLSGDGTERMMKVFDDSRFFYAFHTISADEIEVSAIIK
ncbi:hypothetical protein [Thalassobacillus hwangdonensis]|uniref:DUF4309 domain-containing protein n=1 Tax=Thalassobacillus hwangdonensis TaxID=546108 RepID=A0ABW3L7N7_9BACI